VVRPASGGCCFQFKVTRPLIAGLVDHIGTEIRCQSYVDRIVAHKVVAKAGGGSMYSWAGSGSLTVKPSEKRVVGPGQCIFRMRFQSTFGMKIRWLPLRGVGPVSPVRKLTTEPICVADKLCVVGFKRDCVTRWMYSCLSSRCASIEETS